MWCVKFTTSGFRVRSDLFDMAGYWRRILESWYLHQKKWNWNGLFCDFFFNFLHCFVTLHFLIYTRLWCLKSETNRMNHSHFTFSFVFHKYFSHWESRFCIDQALESKTNEKLYTNSVSLVPQSSWNRIYISGTSKHIENRAPESEGWICFRFIPEIYF